MFRCGGRPARLTNADFRKLLMTPRAGPAGAASAQPAATPASTRPEVPGKIDKAEERRKKKRCAATRHMGNGGIGLSWREARRNGKMCFLNKCSQKVLYGWIMKFLRSCSLPPDWEILGKWHNDGNTLIMAGHSPPL